MGALDQLLRGLRFVDGAHVAEVEIRIDPHAIAHCPPASLHTGTERDLPRMSQSAILIPEMVLVPMTPRRPEAVLLHDLDELLDVTRGAADHERSRILGCASPHAR
jgi:hypothetical protein